jgi:L-fuculose-phosphate aldolase
MDVSEHNKRIAIVSAAQEMDRQGLNHGSTGNLSIRHGEAMLITPSGVESSKLKPELISLMPLENDAGSFEGPLPPSSEWRFHLDILRMRRDVNAIAHMHSTYATTLAVLNRDIPAVHYMIAAFGGPTVRCVGYAPYGSSELSQFVLDGLNNRDGVLLANHGAIVTGPNMQRALWRALELENLARIYYQAMLVGEPIILSDAEIYQTVERFKNYGPAKE